MCNINVKEQNVLQNKEIKLQQEKKHQELIGVGPIFDN